MGRQNETSTVVLAYGILVDGCINIILSIIVTQRLPAVQGRESALSTVRTSTVSKSKTT